MKLWNSLWCFYNSSAFETFAAIGLLGTFSLVIPSLFALPVVGHPALGERHTPYIIYRRARKKALVLGSLAGVISLVAPVFYFQLLMIMQGETCKVSVQPPIDIVYRFLIGLYGCTILSLVLYGFFYFAWREAQVKHGDISKTSTYKG
jgi:hypothetical protein